MPFFSFRICHSSCLHVRHLTRFVVDLSSSHTHVPTIHPQPHYIRLCSCDLRLRTPPRPHTTRDWRQRPHLPTYTIHDRQDEFGSSRRTFSFEMRLPPVVAVVA